MFKPRQFVASLALMAVLITGCTSGGGGTASTQATPTPIPPPVVPEKPTYTVRRGEVVDSLSFTGRVSPVIEESLYFRSGGRVKRVYVERNDVVEAGTVLAELENDDLLRQLAQAQIELETAELNLSEADASQQFTIDKAAIDLDVMRLQLSKLQQSLAGANLDVELAQAALDDARAGADEIELQIAKSELERARNGLWSAQVSRDSTCGQTKGAACDSAQANVQSAEESVRIQELRLQEMLAGPDAAALRSLGANLEKATQDRGRLFLDIQIQQQNIRLKELEVAKLEAEIDPQLTKNVDRNKLAVERLQAQVAETQIVSPIPGKVTSVSAYEGRNTEAYREVFVVADESDLEVTAEPLSSQLQRLQEGMDASLVLSAYPGKELVAKIVQLPYPYGGGGGQSLEEADKMTHISFDPADLVLNPGDLVRVNVVIERKDDTLWLPPAAIRTFSGRTFVVVQEGDVQRRADVTVGIQSTDRVEIKEGLEEGQIIVGQ
ncbi:MAG: efflux RND transporter periplasmic adaptor subunit [Anaerolineae bacterium]|jgi:HlyD family secretion protein